MGMKRPLMIFTLISSVLSLIVIFLSYFGLIRYGVLHIRSPEKYIESYSKLPKASKKRVVITMTTTPYRIGNLEPTINSLLDQTVKVDMLALNIYSKGKYDTPKYLEKIVNIFKYKKDYDAFSARLIPTLFREKECDTIIIAVSDDRVYGKEFVEDVVNEIEKGNGKVLTNSDGTVVAVTPEFFGCDVVKYEGFDNDWLKHHSKRGVQTWGHDHIYRSLK